MSLLGSPAAGGDLSKDSTWRGSCCQQSCWQLGSLIQQGTQQPVLQREAVHEGQEVW